MIELLVAMVLLAIVGGIVTQAVLGGVRGMNDTAASSDAMSQAADAADRLGTDVRAARRQGRSGALVEQAELKSAINSDGDLYPLTGGPKLDWRDIASADATSMTIQADVVDEPGASKPECVTWSIANATGGWYLRRVVKRYSVSCGGGGGATLEDDAMTTPTTALPRPTGLFTYVVTVAAGGTCRTNAAIPNPGAAALNRITSVRIDFSSLATHGTSSASSAQLLDEISIRSRAGNDYQYALGCDT
jgi:type II secretory pathway pseudopilin PulG